MKAVGETGSVINGFSYAFYYLQIPKSGTTLNNVVVYPQINEGETLLEYEPYTGGKPSPNPEYPQEIKAVVNPVIKTHGVNILDIKDIEEKVDKNNGLTYSVQKGAQIDMEWKPQLIISNTLPPYQPYQSSQATLPYELYAIPVDSGGNVTIDGQQYIADYVDIERGKLVRRTRVIKFTGVEDWVYTDSDKESSRRFGVPIQVKGVLHLGLSNYVINTKLIENTENAFVFYGTWVDVRITKFTSLAEFKNFLSEMNSGGKPLIVIYVLVTPEEIDLTPEAIEAFKALSTYYPKTYADAESEQLEAYTMFNYPVSMEKGWEYVKQQIGDTRKYVYNTDTKLTKTEASTLEAKIDTAILSEMLGG